MQSAYGVGETHLESDPLPFSSGDLNLKNERAHALKFDAIEVSELPPAQLTILQFTAGVIPARSLIVGDPYLQYLDTLEPGERLRAVIVGGASTSLRAIFPLINGTEHEESIVDGGSQIVSMAEHIA